MSLLNAKRPVWEPFNVEDTNVFKFIQFINEKHRLQLQTYGDLHAWSVAAEMFQTFWEDAFLWFRLSPPGLKDHPGPMLEGTNEPVPPLFPPPRFFPDAALNLAEIMLRGRRDQDLAIHFASEGRPGIERVTWGQLRERTRRVRSALVNSGVQCGDVIAAVISNSVDAFVIALAALSVGAIWSSSSCDLGAQGIVERYGQVEPKIIFADDGYIYGGKTISLDHRIADWSHKLGQANRNLANVVLIPYCDLAPSLSTIHRGCTFESFLRRDSGEALNFRHVPFSQPGFILYSSGTTGKPKCIVHTVGGVALKVKTDMVLQHDVRRTDVVFQYTTTSWVMWVLNFVNLSCGKSMLLYDGSPFYPRTTVLLELAAEVGVNIFGTSPGYLAKLKSLGVVPRCQYDLRKLRTVTSTGSVLPADLYEWFYSTAFPRDAQLFSMSGGTDIAGCFVGGTPLLPIYAGEIQCKALGMAVDILDSEEERAVSVEAAGKPGELVCTRPFPSQPVAFVGKDWQSKYRSSYFERFGAEVWCQGDFVQCLVDTGGLLMLGRSDGVLNPSGVRFGSAEIYAVTDGIPELEDALCVGQKRSVDADERVVLFVRMKAGAQLTAGVEKRIREAIRDRCSSRHVPKYVFEVADIPYTVNGKKCEIIVKHIISGHKAVASGTVANPNALRLYKKYQDLPTEGPTVELFKSNL